MTLRTAIAETQLEALEWREILTEMTNHLKDHGTNGMPFMGMMVLGLSLHQTWMKASNNPCGSATQLERIAERTACRNRNGRVANALVVTIQLVLQGLTMESSSRTATDAMRPRPNE